MSFLLRIAAATLLLALFHNATAQAQAPADTLYMDVVAYWEPGEQRTLEVTKGKRQFKDGQLVTNDSSATRFTVTVEAATDTSYIMQ